MIIIKDAITSYVPSDHDMTIMSICFRYCADTCREKNLPTDMIEKIERFARLFNPDTTMGGRFQ